MVVGDVGLHFQRVPHDVARNGCGGLAAAFVSGTVLHFGTGKEHRTAQGDLPFAADDVAGLRVEAPARINPGAGFVVENRVGAGPAHEVGAERESPVFEQEIGVPAAEIAACAVGQEIAALAVRADRLVVVGIGARQQYLDLLFVGQVALERFALLLEPPQRIEFQPPCVDQPAAGRTAPIAPLAQGDGAFGRKGEPVAARQVVADEDAEIAVGAEFAVDDAAVDELQHARRGDLGASCLYLGLSQPETPGRSRAVVEYGVADDVGVAAGVGGVAREPKLDGVNQLRRVDVSVELDLQALDAGLDFVQPETAVERECHKVLHPQPHGERKPLAGRTVGDALADFEGPFGGHRAGGVCRCRGRRCDCGMRRGVRYGLGSLSRRRAAKQP